MNFPKKLLFCQIRVYMLLFTIMLPLLLSTGCEREEDTKTSSIDFTVVTDSDIPKDLKKIIKERRKNPFELSYSDGSYLYVVKGYGKQQTTDYSIIVNDFYKSDDALIFDTELYGPKKDDKSSQTPSYPYIVVKTEYIENSIIFK